MKKTQFIPPEFGDRHLEIRVEGEVVCLYGTPEGLSTLAEFALDLVNNPGQGHVHLDNQIHKLLTRDSKSAVIAIFESE